MTFNSMVIGNPPSYYEMYPELEPKNYWSPSKMDVNCAFGFDRLNREIVYRIELVRIIDALTKLKELRKRRL